MLTSILCARLSLDGHQLRIELAWRAFYGFCKRARRGDFFPAAPIPLNFLETISHEALFLVQN
jgi:hypothetical protein